jgi:predicted TIM-barrel fold metal-dependent hydrolase
VLYPSRGLHTLSRSDLAPRFAAALARAYNDWLYDFSRADPSRLLGAGMVSPFDIGDAVFETRRCVKELGFRAVFLRANVANGRTWHDPYLTLRQVLYQRAHCSTTPVHTEYHWQLPRRLHLLVFDL